MDGSGHYYCRHREEGDLLERAVLRHFTVGLCCLYTASILPPPVLPSQHSSQLVPCSHILAPSQTKGQYWLCLPALDGSACLRGAGGLRRAQTQSNWQRGFTVGQRWRSHTGSHSDVRRNP